MRQGNREITELNEIIGVMKKCDVCRLALNDNGYPYILPLNFGMEKRQWIFLPGQSLENMI